MNHPAPETWMAYLYDELGGPARVDADAHLQVCPHCRQSVDRLRATLAVLDQDKASLVIPRCSSRTTAWWAATRWALAASILLLAGFLAGRATGTGPAEVQREVAAVREELQGRFSEELRAMATATLSAAAEENRRLLTDFARDLEAGRTSDRRDLLAALAALDQRRAVESEALLAGLVTLARRTGSSFQQTGSQLNLLAAHLPTDTPSGSSNTPITDKQP